MVSSIFYFHPYLGRIPILTNIFQRGWNHQPVIHSKMFFLGGSRGADYDRKLMARNWLFRTIIQVEESGSQDKAEFSTSIGSTLLSRSILMFERVLYSSNAVGSYLCTHVYVICFLDIDILWYFCFYLQHYSHTCFSGPIGLRRGVSTVKSD